MVELVPSKKWIKSFVYFDAYPLCVLDNLSFDVLQTCSRGMACNFIHCFRNPGGDYEWADSDKPPPRYWFRKMAFLFGYFDESACERQRVPENLDQPNRSGKISTADADRCAFSLFFSYCHVT